MNNLKTVIRMIMKKILALFVVLFLALCGLQAQVVYSCDYKYEADVKVYVTQYKYEADLVVYKCPYKYEATDNKGLWYFTNYKYEAKKKIYFTDYKYDADLVIYFSDYKYEAGWKKKEKMHLMY
ncbi:MAG: DUF6150 family protein [Bacteroidales bacterium]|nr:DUF6150 family protein [Bacteroidales bacterium]